MGIIYWDDREVFHEGKEIESASKASELKMDFKKISRKHPLRFNAKPPFSKETDIFIRFLSLNRRYLQCGTTDLAADKVSNSLSLFCRTASVFTIPVNLRSSEVLIESLGHSRRTRSTNDLGDFIVQYNSAIGLGSVFISPSVQCISASMEGSVAERSLLKGLLCNQLGTLDSGIRPFLSRSFSPSPIRSSMLSSPLARVCSASTQDDKVEAAATPEGGKSELKISNKLLDSCSSSDSTGLHQSSSSPQHLMSKGLLHFVWRNGSPYFVFSVGDDCSKVFVANVRKFESSVDKVLDYLYLFHSVTGKKTSEFVGQMKVSSSLVLASNHSKFMEMEFVLFGAKNLCSKKLQGSTSFVIKGEGFSKKVADIFRPNHFTKQKLTQKTGELSSQIEDFLRDSVLDEFGNSKKSVSMDHIENDFIPNLELAAIVIRDKLHDINKEAAVGGWGLKFLEKVAFDQADTSLDPSLHGESHEGSNVRSQGASSRSTSVLIPADLHGGAITRSGGPSSLLERWRSGGHCDCGGWDIGCPLTVLQECNSDVSMACSKKESQNHCKSVDLFTEGAKHGEPSMKMIYLNEGMYTVSYQSSLSALQAFSIGVAIIHAQTPALRPKF